MTGEKENDEADDAVKAVTASQASAIPVEPVMSRPVEADAVELAYDNDRGRRSST